MFVLEPLLAACPSFQGLFSDHISGTPSLCCQVGTLDESSAIEICNENGMHAVANGQPAGPFP